MDLTPSTPQTSSGSSNDLASNVPDQELDAGSECGWRDTDAGARPIFYMGDEELNKYPAVSGLFKNIDGQKIRVGICAMSKKTNSKPMKEILARLERFENLQVHIFEEKVILGEPVERWPVVDALVSFFSTGFPLQKAIQYKNLYKPFVVNDLEAQYAIKDRREVYKILVREGISHPRYAVMNRDCEEKADFDENEDAIDVNGTQFQRPFVEKPVDAEDHNIYIYFPVSAGGGCQKLFRKVGSRSSVYSQCNRVRKTGSFIYEDFMPTDGTDVKVYTVGPDYAHAEARKSPALDGKVERDKEGKEVRFPVILSAAEKMIARKVCLAFKQNVCGFDLLRTGGKSYVCDVNGFSFVKNSTKYYDDCANVLGTMIIRALAPQLHIPLILGAAPEDIPILPTTSGSMMELRCVIAVIRHGDRTPKQKMKMEVKHKKFFDLFAKYNGYKKGHLKLKKPKQLQEVLDISRDLLSESLHESNAEVLEKKAKLRQLKLVLEMYGHFSGINRKVQLKYQPNGAPKKSFNEEGLQNEVIESVYHSHASHEYPKEPSLVLIVKWGGELTPAGKFQAEDLGKAFRTLYPGGQGEFETPGLGFLRLHSTFRHDLKIYASDEGRVQMTAAAFTKGLLALEGELTPILVSMVKSANTNGLLDKEGETSKYQHIVKEKLMEILNQGTELNEDDVDRLAPTHNSSLVNAIDYIKNPRKMCESIYEMVCEITTRIKALKMELKSRDLKLYHGESWELLIRRWSKLEKDYKLKTGSYDISKIPDIYDCIKYDLQHNQKTLQYARAQELFQYSKALADIVIPQEYGITVEEKVHISQSICTPLMRKIHSDLIQACQGLDEHSTRLNSKYSKGVASPERFVRTRLYFTSESHIHSLLNMLRYGGLCDDQKDEQWMKAMDFLSSTPELNYMTQINIMMFEDPTKEAGSPEKFHVELHFSPGAYTSCDKSVVNPVSSGYRTSFLVKQAHMFKEGKDENSSSSLKDKLKDGLITEEISEETSDDTMSGHNSIVLGDGIERTLVLNETGMNSFFSSRDEAESSDSKSYKDESIGATNELNDMGVEQNKEAIAFGSIKTDKKFNESEDMAEAIEIETTTITEHIDIERSVKTNDVEITGIENNITEDTKEVKTGIPLTDDGRNFVSSIEDPKVINSKEAIDAESDDAKVLNEESSLSSLYLTADEPDEDKVGTNEPNYLPSAEKHSKLDCPSSVMKVDNTTTDDCVIDDSNSDGVEVVEKVTSIENSKLEHVHPESSADDQSNIKGSYSSSISAYQREIEADNDSLKKSVEIQSKHPIKFPNTLNVQSFVSIPPRETRCTKDAENDNLSGEDDLKHDFLFPVDLREVPQPKSPDPDIPEWDWGDEKVKNSSILTDSDRMKEPQRPRSAGMISSLPIAITPCGSLTRRGSDPKKPYEESRSHSLEESDSKDGSLAFLEKHYRTIHLPINNDSHHSFSSLLYLNPDAFKAFDGFNMVPSLKPLETLHNNLTMKDLDGFLCRATTTKFFTPVSSNVTTPLPSPRCPELNRTKSSGPSLPSSSNSSAGPSSPTSASTPIDFLSRLKMYIIDSVTLEQGQTETDADLSSESSLGSTSQHQETNQATVIPQRKKPLVPESSITAGPNPTDGLNMATTGHVSAFKAVSRSSGQKTQFLVTHVPEDSLLKNKQEKNDVEESLPVSL